ncbi:MAG: 4Fe-4S binding protein, partial [Deltaproteobacteria bacterium]|nr:4Fe-4S binding protein [Deltaproteobacteria bacterium]
MYEPYRRVIQLAAFAVMFVIPLLNMYEIYAITGTFYAVNIGGLGIADPAVILQAFFASGGLTPVLLSAAFFAVLVALLFGRVWCGWSCPYHLVSDMSVWLRARFQRVAFGRTDPETLPLPRSFAANISRFSFLILGTVAAGAIGIPVLNYVSAPGILSTEVMVFVKERTLSVEAVFIAMLVVLEIAVLPRFWCRLFCPTGAFLSLFRLPFTMHVSTGIRTPKSPCCKGNYCSKSCPMGL